VSEAWPWLALGLLGVYHGVNPAMGWLFAVALGLQEKRLTAVLQALVPIAIGHELSIAAAAVAVRVVELVAVRDLLRGAGAVALVGFGAFKLLRPRAHPRWVGMRVNQRDLLLWSFLMSSAHGAGLMLFPLLLGLSAPTHAEGMAAPVLSLGGASLLRDAATVTVHTLAMLATMALVAVVVYARLGVIVLRKAWVNFDAVWAGALVLAGTLALFT
jgi:hypothetical protein